MKQKPTYEELLKRVHELESNEYENNKRLACVNEQIEDLKNLLDCVTFVVYMKDDKGVYTYINKGFENLSQLKQENVLGKTDLDLFPEKGAEKTSQNDRIVMETGHPLEIEEIGPVHGEMHRFSSLKYPLRSQHGDIHGVFGISTDITAQKQVEKELILLRNVVEQSVDGLAVVDMEGNLQYLNAAFAQLHGYDPKDLIGKNLTIFHSKDQLAEVEAANQQTKNTGKFYGEIWHVRKDGTAFPGLMHNSLIKNAQGKPVGMTGTLRDISNLKKIEKELRESEERFKTTFENAPVGIILADFDGTFKSANKKMYEMFGYDYNLDAEENIVIEKITHKDDEHTIEWFRKLTSHEIDNYTIEKRYVRKDGSTMWGRATVVAIYSQTNQPKYILVIIEDVSRVKKFEKELRSANYMLEKRVRERTDELEKLNVALRVLLDHREKEKEALEETIASTATVQITPFIDRLKKNNLSESQNSLLTMIENGLKEMVSPFSGKLNTKLSGLTPREKEVALLIRDGFTNAAAADALAISEHSVAFHRQNVRRKLGLKNTKANLTSYLQDLPEL
ncbi:MAG: PAS domain S-box protein [Deltaproteobacteria bacterium]|nr:PAS domain S-box protein [Deltaproteobacteria bacterium]